MTSSMMIHPTDQFNRREAISTCARSLDAGPHQASLGEATRSGPWFPTFSENSLRKQPACIHLPQIIALLRPRPRARCLLNSTTTFVVSHQTISMTTAPRTGRSPLEEFLPEVDMRRENVGSLIDSS